MHRYVNLGMSRKGAKGAKGGRAHAVVCMTIADAYPVRVDGKGHVGVAYKSVDVRIERSMQGEASMWEGRDEG